MFFFCPVSQQRGTRFLCQWDVETLVWCMYIQYLLDMQTYDWIKCQNDRQDEAEASHASLRSQKRVICEYINGRDEKPQLWLEWKLTLIGLFMDRKEISGCTMTDTHTHTHMWHRSSVAAGLAAQKKTELDEKNQETQWVLYLAASEFPLHVYVWAEAAPSSHPTADVMFLSHMSSTRVRETGLTFQDEDITDSRFYFRQNWVQGRCTFHVWVQTEKRSFIVNLAAL